LDDILPQAVHIFSSHTSVLEAFCFR